ncbi:MAG: hypothetical protein AUK47_20365 [Deltaproteobacteria bacterium CG2_30_63_29]|nr:MAG: hypothetical protein AUK47_20365 [Deltaproteobacteria bacterium CG2_30_63_29]PJB48033.1 MAG: hypothetical protein CO108_03105 [Deltaproteobacteria bacterium CG_4_9_14_3_um_filter_63_12]
MKVIALITFLLALSSFASGCSDEGTDTAQNAPSDELLVEAPGEVLARVDGRPIRRSQLDALLTRSAGKLDAEHALAELMELEVMAGEAIKRGLDGSLTSEMAKERAMVQRLLEDRVEELPDNAISDSLVQEMYDTYAMEFFVPELVTASHLLFELPSAQQTPERVAEVMALAKELRAALKEPTEAELERLALLANIRGYIVRVEKNLTFPLRAVPAMVSETSRYPGVVEPFADAAFALSIEQPLSEPTLTTFGVHVILFKKRTQGRRPPFEVVESRIREDLIARMRSKNLSRLIDKVHQNAKIAVDESAIDEAVTQGVE